MWYRKSQDKAEEDQTEEEQDKVEKDWSEEEQIRELDL